MPTRRDPLDNFQKLARSLAVLISAITTAAIAGHTIGWW